MAKPSGYIVYRGPSLIDGSPIVAVATHGSKNAKTGGMVQTWIIRTDIEPHKALKTGADVAVCGDCPHRGGSCYVQVHQAPLSVYRAYHRGRYPMLPDGAPYAGRMVRVGSYGDPAAVPVEAWERLLAGAAGHTGYTHQWRTADVRLARFCMASSDSPRDRDAAKAAGYRTFRIRLADENVAAREVICPASAEGGHKLLCAQCGACNGTATARRGDVVIVAHGAKHKVAAYKAMRATN